jgi:hypothetical protein
LGTEVARQTAIGMHALSFMHSVVRVGRFINNTAPTIDHR